MDRSSKADRKTKIKAWKETEKESARAEFPLPDEQLEVFFAQLASVGESSPCFNDIRGALRVIEYMGLSASTADALLDWCNNNGGFCDCEIAGNTYDRWQSNRLAPNNSFKPKPLRGSA